MFEYLMAGFANVFQPMNLLLTIFGTVVGVVIGCLPGLSGSMGIILLRTPGTPSATAYSIMYLVWLVKIMW